MNRAKGLFFAMITAFAVTGCGAGAAEETIHESFATADFQKFAVSLQGEDVGYMTMETEAVGDSLFITQSMEWHLLLMGTTRTVTMEVSARTGTNMDLGYLTMTMSDGTSVIETTARRTGNTVETTVNTSGREIVNSSEFEGNYLPSFVDLAAATMEWVVGDEKIFPTFDPSTGMIFEAIVTCEAIEDVSLMGDMVPAARLLIAQQGMRNVVWVYQGQIVREEEAGMGMVLTRVAPDTEDNIIPSTDLYEAYAVTSSAVRDPRNTGERSWLLVGDVDWNEFELDYPGIQNLSDGPIITVTATVPQNPVVFPMEEAADEHAPYLEADAMIQCTDPVIIAVADSLTEGATDAWDAVARISRFVDRQVENVPTVSLPSAVDVLDNKRGDCNEHTILTVALCRAVGIPAVTCAGIVYVDNGIFGYHAWPAVWVGEWVAIDPTFGQQVADCTHIVLAQGSLDAQYVVNGVLGRLSIEEYTGQEIIPRIEEIDGIESAIVVAHSDVWYAEDLRAIFPTGIELSHATYSLDDLPCLPNDICSFTMETELVGEIVPAFQVSGSLRVDAITEPYEAFNGEDYLLSLSAFIVNRSGEVIWSQDGYPQGDSWASIDGGNYQFRLISSFEEELVGSRILVVASADPIRTPNTYESRMVIGVGEKDL